MGACGLGAKVDSMCSNVQDVQLLSLRQVSKIYVTPAGDFAAIDQVDVSFAKGEFVAIVGKSGSGKSTLLNLIAGIDRPSSGEIFVGATRLQGLSESALSAWRGRNVGVVFQFFQLLPTLTVLENVTLPMDFCHTYAGEVARERARGLLAQVGIAEQAHKLPAALSGGQQQRAAIARALANDPPLIVADEPTGNLDSHTAQAVLELLTGLTARSKTVLMVTHERDLTQIADRVVTLADGKIEQISVGRASASPELRHG